MEKNAEHQVIVHIKLAILFEANLIARPNAVWIFCQVICCDRQVIQDKTYSIVLANTLFQCLQCQQACKSEKTRLECKC